MKEIKNIEKGLDEFLLDVATKHPREKLDSLIKVTTDTLKIREKLTADQLVKLQTEIGLAEKLYRFFLELSWSDKL